jgi:hypothetical protein
MREYPAPLRLFEKKIYFGTNNAAANDVFQVIPVITNDIVFSVWAEVVTACTTSATVDLGYGTDPDYFGKKLLVDSVGHCRNVLFGTKTWNPYLVYDKSSHTDELNVAGARHGDHVTASPSIDVADMTLDAKVIHDDWVSLTYSNLTGGRLDLPEHTIDVVVGKAPNMASPLHFTSSDTIDVTANTAITAGVLKVSALIFRKNV